MAVSGTGTAREISFGVSARLYGKLEALARERGTRPAVHAHDLFQAAFAAAVGVAPNRDLDAAVARTIVLAGAGTDAALIAANVGLTEATVGRILDAWRAETGAALEGGGRVMAAAMISRGGSTAARDGAGARLPFGVPAGGVLSWAPPAASYPARDPSPGRRRSGRRPRTPCASLRPGARRPGRSGAGMAVRLDTTARPAPTRSREARP